MYWTRSWILTLTVSCFTWGLCARHVAIMMPGANSGVCVTSPWARAPIIPWCPHSLNWNQEDFWIIPRSVMGLCHKFACPHFDSFPFHLRFLCKAYFHCKALNDFWCLSCKSLSKHPNCPILSMLLQLKLIFVSFDFCRINITLKNSLSQFPVSEALPVHGWPPV